MARARPLVGEWAQPCPTAPGYHVYDPLPGLDRSPPMQASRALHGLDAVRGRGDLQLVGALEGVLMSGKYQVYPHVVERLQGGATGLLVPAVVTTGAWTATSTHFPAAFAR